MLSLIPLPWRLAGLGVVLALAGWGVMRWRASLIEGGIAMGERRQLAADETRMKREREADLAEIARLRSALQAEGSKADAERAALRRERSEMYKGLDERLAAIQAGREASDAGIAAIPGDRLDDAIRSELSRLGEPGGPAGP